MGKLDILLGTQMIAKGLDFPRVTLVGIVNADVGLHMPDFRSGERAFQQIIQVAGRAGRGDVAGEVLVQTFTPDHSAIRFARLHDFEKFYREESGFRKELDYPPFNHLTLIHFSSRKEAQPEFVAEQLRKTLEKKIGSSLKILGPCSAPLGRLCDRHRVHLLLRDSRIKHQKQIVRETLAALPRSGDVRVSADVDPLNMM
jgi:primosomal protein N' (replication factor Y)